MNNKGLNFGFLCWKNKWLFGYNSENFVFHSPRTNGRLSTAFNVPHFPFQKTDKLFRCNYKILYFIELNNVFALNLGIWNPNNSGHKNHVDV